MNLVPNFTSEQLDRLDREVRRLSDVLKKVSGERTNPLIKELEDVMNKRSEELMMKPLFFQALFLSAALGYDETLSLLEQKIETLKED